MEFSLFIFCNTEERKSDLGVGFSVLSASNFENEECVAILKTQMSTQPLAPRVQSMQVWPVDKIIMHQTSGKQNA